MAASNSLKSFDLSREGKDLRIRMQVGDITVSRLSRAFQASTVHASTVHTHTERKYNIYSPTLYNEHI